MSSGLIILSLVIAFLYGSYNFFIKLSSEQIDHILGAAILQYTALLLGLPVLLFLKLKGAPIEVTTKGITYSVSAGILIGLAEILSFYFFEDTDVSIGLPVIIGGSVLCGSCLGFFILHEKLTVLQIIGILMVIIGIAIISFNTQLDA
ncbi:MAG: EamA family transporter [Moorea sp. SIO3I7]|uniref:EamA family transporter n=1 Tax=Moorena sp. SIO3I8 TaxID=2607833 RepID=UPI0013B99808|nr:EamA family transporter [Moorena sp. SIO3I8]NEN98967.1 EamA family transporter [Moorena sp. SIO3I7]NEO10252.1 EamA family transporter [Moorena sp. SIO3I8]NEQ86834.1 EamA family transporter [Moorena sp. SIO2I5]